ncbi:MAG: DNA modification methylase [Candidatus Omnitrophica bacterium]|nr:DNA modification methylase [Candidatus Omnitrophota bacterium]
MLIKKMQISQLKPAEYNPRLDLKPGDAVYEQLSQSLDDFDLVEPLVFNQQTGTLVSGHLRLKVLIDKGFTEVETVIVDMPLEKEKKLNIALNKIRGDWDQDKLGALLQEFMQEPDFNPQASGFEWDEVSKTLQGLGTPEEDDFDLEEELDAIGEIITKPGDVIELGPHRIMCGDSTDPEVLKRLIGDEKIDLIWEDYPYGVLYKNDRPGVKTSRWDKIENDDLQGEDHAEWCRKALQAIKPFLKEGASFYLWDGFRNFGFLTQILIEEGFHVSNVVTWVKPYAAPSWGPYAFRSEFCLFGWDKRAPHKFYGGKNASNVWEVDREPTKNLEHPTVKPVELTRRALQNSSVIKDRVFDGCMGSGGALLCAYSMNRLFFGVDVEPKYVDVSIRRYLRMVGRARVSPEVWEKYGKELDHVVK